jgi:hypothetical protein
LPSTSPTVGIPSAVQADGLLLAGDVGGTKTVLEIFSDDRGPGRPLAVKTYPSGAYPGLEAVAGEFLTGVRLPDQRACFAVAGPVAAGRAERAASLARRLAWGAGGGAGGGGWAGPVGRPARQPQGSGQASGLTTVTRSMGLPRPPAAPITLPAIDCWHTLSARHGVESPSL